MGLANGKVHKEVNARTESQEKECDGTITQEKDLSRGQLLRVQWAPVAVSTNGTCP